MSFQNCTIQVINSGTLLGLTAAVFDTKILYDLFKIINNLT